ncbi:MAG TPA: IclR family transcriptional regulator C-terminal domain-containing protein [Caulobacteraceae bacterium]|nr:IclR family transcriptional regulator C-terminal domain-containing protein [Caulobacteraceae bacterium]
MKNKFPYADILAQQDPEFIAGFAKGLAVVEVFGEENQRLTISQVSERVGLDRATVRRCLLTLTRLGYAEYDGKFFSLTPRMLRLGYAYLSSTPFIGIVQPFLEELAQKLGHTCAVAKLDGAEIVYLARATEASRLMTINRSVGGRLPAYGASLGRVILAGWPEDKARELLESRERPQLTPKTLTEIPDLMAELAKVRAQGYAINDEETAPGLLSIAVPLVDGAGRTTAGLNVGATTAQANVDQMVSEFLPAMLDIQRRLRQLIA